MRVTIIRTDGKVIVDGVAAAVDCADLPSFFHVIQWDGVAGWIELERAANGVQPGNLPIASLAPWQVYLDRWAAARAAAEHADKTAELSAAERAAELRRVAQESEAADLRQAEEMAAAQADFARIAAKKEAESSALRQRVAALERQMADMADRIVALSPAVEPRT